MESEVEEKPGKRRWRYAGAAAVLSVVGLVAWFVFKPESAPPPQPAPALAAFDPASDALGVSLGAADAPVVVREFADFECPACGGFEPVLEYMRKQYVDSGKVRFVFFDYPLTHIHPHALRAAELARCAGAQGHYWAMHDLLYVRQQEWARAEDSGFDPTPQFESYAKELKLDAPALMQCFNRGDTEAAVKKAAAYGDKLGVYATPTFGVNRVTSVGGVAYDDLRNLIEAQLKTATAAPAPTSN